MGHIHMSFEYHVHKSMLKIKIWQLSDLLLPPPQISMIQSVYVRSYLIPPAAKKTFVRTEEVRVENLEAHVNVKPREQKPLTGIQHIFTPSNFKFLTPMEYNGVTQDVIRDRSIQIEVCMIQKTTRKSFLIGMVNIPLNKAVKKVVREKIPLIPCLNYTTPNNMRVYSAAGLELERNGESFDCSPLLRQLSGNGVSGVIVPDENLIKPVYINNIRHKNHNNNDICPPGVKVHDIDREDEIAVDIAERVAPSPPLPLTGSGLETANLGDKKLIKVNLNDLEINDVIASANQLKVPHIKEPKKPAIVYKPDTAKQNGSKSPEINTRKKLSVPVDLEIDDNSDMEIDSELPDLNVTSPAASRPETPVWDYYDFEYEAGTKPKAKNSTSSKKSTSSVSS
ncbi:uncharacterized protein LOC126828836 [Patella vulgata]|uniref:uncharacterized protein LOC126828836 n=1 Tax=Patella vulgata TaxID=6465 RepID=UPI0024A9D4DF|nr:uncharacterized protein LOC126828836 [Patella vulgata]XP_050414799.2 uncharacterized protein LOC126828836 [Patella vulgata]XP_050414800.2 uncharacterized protein LOC126828836 [Patella vulgata]